MTTVQPGDTFVAVLRFLVVILIEISSVLLSNIPLNKQSITISDRVQDIVREYDTKTRELLDPDELTEVLKEELESSTAFPEDVHEDEAMSIGTAVQRNVPLHECIFTTLVEEHTVLAYDAGRFSFSFLITCTAVLAVLYTRIVEFSISAIPLLGIFLAITVFFFGGTSLWFRQNISSVNDYAKYRKRWPITPISVAIIGYNLTAIIGIVLIDVYFGPVELPEIQLKAILLH